MHFLSAFLLKEPANLFFLKYLEEEVRRVRNFDVINLSLPQRSIYCSSFDFPSKTLDLSAMQQFPPFLIKPSSFLSSRVDHGTQQPLLAFSVQTSLS